MIVFMKMVWRCGTAIEVHYSNKKTIEFFFEMWQKQCGKDWESSCWWLNWQSWPAPAFCIWFWPVICFKYFFCCELKEMLTFLGLHAKHWFVVSLSLESFGPKNYKKRRLKKLENNSKFYKYDILFLTFSHFLLFSPPDLLKSPLPPRPNKSFFFRKSQIFVEKYKFFIFLQNF